MSARLSASGAILTPIRPTRYEWPGMAKTKTHRNTATAAKRQLERIETGVRGVRSDLRDFRVSLEPLVPHIGAIEQAMQDVQLSLERIERGALPPTRRVRGRSRR